jgi:hypothetical protein
VTPCSFGETYLTIRDQLASLMAGVASLAADTGVDVTAALPLDELRGGLRRPFVFAVCGEVNSGKSSLLNALTGTTLCRTNVVPETLRVTRIVHSHRAEERTTEDGVVEHAHPHDFLHDFHWIDTPGLNTAGPEQLAIMASVLPRTDVILCALHADNPWSAAAWNFLTEMTADTLDKVILVIQQADRREAKDLAVLHGHLRDLSMKRLGRLPPVFAVSAQRAMDARKQSPADLAAWRASGFAALVDHLERTVCQSPARWAILSGWRDAAARALRMIDDRMEDSTRGIKDHARFIEDVEREIDALRDRFVKRLPQHLADVADVFSRETRAVARVLSRRLGLLPSLFRLFHRGKVGVAIEQLFINRLKAAVETVADADAAEVVDSCKAHWHDLGPRVNSLLGFRLGGGAEVDDVLKQSRAAFVRRLGQAAGQGIDNLHVRRQLDADLRERNLSLTSHIAATLTLTTAGAVCGALDLPVLPWVFCGLAALFLIGGIVSALVTRRAIIRDHQDVLADACGRFAATLRGDYEDALRILFRDYAQCLGALHGHLVRENATLEPRQRRWQEMFLHLKAIEQEI